MSEFKNLGNKLSAKKQAAKKSNMSARERILGCIDVQQEEMFIDKWNEAIIVREMPAMKRYELIYEVGEVTESGNDMLRNSEMIKVFAKIVSACVVDPSTGERMFTDEDAEQLAYKDESVIVAIATKAMDISGLSKKSKEDIEKN